MYQYASTCAACAFESIGIDGVESKVLYTNDVTKQKTVVTKMAAGAVIPRHLHSNANETVYVLEGELIEDGQRFEVGSYFVGAAGTAHGPHITEVGCVLLTHWTNGDVDFVVV